jgi:4-hydroxybutyrate CoA-transferase
LKYSAQYAAKKYAPEQAVALIQKGASVYTGGEPGALLEALYAARDRLDGLKLYSMFGIGGSVGEKINSADMTEHVDYAATVLKRHEERAWAHSKIDQVSVHFSEMEHMVEQRRRPTALLTHCAPMDEEGYFYMNPQAGCGCGRSAADCGAKIIIQVNENIPVIYSDYYRIHISEVTALCEANEPLRNPDAQKREASEADQRMGSYVAERIPNGATIQLGAGAAPDMVGRFLENHKDLGVHTEMFGEAMVPLMKKGVINNSQKTLLRGVSVASFLGGGPVTREFAHKNRDILLKKISWVNDPAVISQIQDIVSVNSCLGVDLRGQVCSESIGLSSSGGIGGQLDFVRGARRAKGGQSFIVMRSALQKKDGTRLSKITLTLPKGSVVSTPRSDVMYVATEYGVAELQYRSVKERAQALISISHPDFREELTFEAKKHGLI